MTGAAKLVAIDVFNAAKTARLPASPFAYAVASWSHSSYRQVGMDVSGDDTGFPAGNAGNHEQAY